MFSGQTDILPRNHYNLGRETGRDRIPTGTSAGRTGSEEGRRRTTVTSIGRNFRQRDDKRKKFNLEERLAAENGKLLDGSVFGCRFTAT